MIDQFKNLSCYEEFEIQCTLTGISKIDILKKIGYKINNYYFFVSNDGIFNWFDLNGNYVKDPGILKELKEEHIPSSITKCVIPDSVTRIGEYTFVYCELLKEVIIPNSVASIGDKAFYYCESLKEITIPDGVIYIGIDTFYYCKSLTSITIPNSVAHISYYAFFMCDALKEIVFKGKSLDEVEELENYPFGIKDESIIKCET